MSGTLTSTRVFVLMFFRSLGGIVILNMSEGGRVSCFEYEGASKVGIGSRRPQRVSFPVLCKFEADIY